MLIPKTDFIGLENLTHLAAGGEAPMLKSHRQALERFFADKALGEAGRDRFEEMTQRCKEKITKLVGGHPDDFALLSSSSEGINLLAYALDWHPGDNVVVVDVEFPSDVLPWTRFQKHGVEIRVVSNDAWYVALEDVEAAIDHRTRVVAISHASYFTGQRLALAELSQMVRRKGALLLVDATHSAGVIPVEASHADILVSSCYKWLLATHGVAIFYWNRKRLPDLEPPFLGWNTGATIPDWREPTSYPSKANADRFVPGNPSFIGIYILENALDNILKVGLPAIESHVRKLATQTWQGVKEIGWDLMTPESPDERAGNVCFTAPNVGSVTGALAEKGIIIWGSYAGVERVRVSTHLYNSEEDVQRLLTALAEIKRS